MPFLKSGTRKSVGSMIPYQVPGIIIPTLATRNDLLEQTLKSINDAGHAFVIVVCPEDLMSTCQNLRFYDLLLPDPKKGLAAAINAGICALPSFIKYVTWLGDDDKLAPDSLSASVEVLETRLDVVLVFGKCHYIDAEDRVLFTNHSGNWAPILMRFGPQLVSQPGSLFRRASFEFVGGLDTSLGWAFDLDLFLKLKRVGKFAYLDFVLGSFRWHSQSLSVGRRLDSVREASSVRRRFLPTVAKSISFLWEIPLRAIMLRVGDRLTKLADSKRQKRF